MTFEEAVAALRSLVGAEVAIALSLSAMGSADGWLADNDGIIARIDDPIEGVDAPVHYIRFADGTGFALHRGMFRDAAWHEIAGQQSLEVALGPVELSIQPVTTT